MAGCTTDGLRAGRRAGRRTGLGAALRVLACSAVLRTAVLGAVVLGAVVLGAVGTTGAVHAADDTPEKAPAAGATGKVYTWKAANGLAYDWYLPKSYDEQKGITLTFILHGSNGWKGWGFSMHAPGEFRPDDLVVSPEGTTPNGQGGFNFLQSSDDLKRLHELHEELRKTFKVNATYIYGLSQGSFFAHYYAGHYGDEVQGIVAHGSGLWIGSGLAKANHHQAIAVMHGRGDPVYPYGGGVGAWEGYVEAKYPLLRFRTLELDLHWAPWGNQAQQLAWCEGMTSSDPERVAANLAWLEEVKDDDGWFRDPVAAYQVALRAASMQGVDGKVQARAKKLAESIDAVAAKQAADIEASFAKTKGKVTDGAAWAGQAALFVRDWRGVPACDAFVGKWQKTLEKHDDAMKDASKDWYKAREKNKTGDAFDAALDALEKGFLNWWSFDADVLKTIAGWRDDAKASGLSAAQTKRYDAVAKPVLEAREKGRKDYLKRNKEL